MQMLAEEPIGNNATAYEVLYNTNAVLLSGRSIPETEKRDIAMYLLSLANTPEEVNSFRKGVGAKGGNRNMYPSFYVPPYNNGNKYRLITGELPKTHILSANHYELEILRLLAMWGEGALAIKSMIDSTLGRLSVTCFGRFCGTGECVGAGVTALRFYSAVLPPEDSRIKMLLHPLSDLYGQSGGRASTYQNLPVKYCRLALAGVSLAWDRNGSESNEP
jgi:hypothetical protein